MSLSQVGCTITTVRTKLSAELMVGYGTHKDVGTPWWWEKVWGRLNLGLAFGNFAFFGNSLALLRTTNGNSPIFISGANVLVLLDSVPQKFAERVTPENKLSGVGNIFQTNEQITWEMWYPTLPIKK